MGCMFLQGMFFVCLSMILFRGAQFKHLQYVTGCIWFVFQGGPGIRGARGDRGEPGVTVSSFFFFTQTPHISWVKKWQLNGAPSLMCRTACVQLMAKIIKSMFWSISGYSWHEFYKLTSNTFTLNFGENWCLLDKNLRSPVPPRGPRHNWSSYEFTFKLAMVRSWLSRIVNPTLHSTGHWSLH